MTAFKYSVRDSLTMFRRDLRHSVRYPLMTISSIMVPVVLLLLFVEVFGGTLRAGMGTAASFGGHYVDYVTPGIILMTACSSAEATAVSVSTDMTQGIITRFRTMAITRSAVLTGQVLGSLVRTVASGVLVIGVAFALGFRSPATPGEWVAALGVFVVLTLALTWLTVALGLFAKSPEGANSMSLLIVFFPFVSSAFVPTGSMPSAVAWFAHNQPFTPVIETIRGVLTGTAIGDAALLGVAWCLGLALVGFLWARSCYAHGPAQ